MYQRAGMNSRLSALLQLTLQSSQEAVWFAIWHRAERQRLKTLCIDGAIGRWRCVGRNREMCRSKGQTR